MVTDLAKPPTLSGAQSHASRPRETGTTPGRFAWNVLLMAGGSGTSQLLLVAAAPVLTRLYTPDDFAVYALVMVAAGLISVVATGRYEFAIALPRSRTAARHLSSVILGVAAVLSCVLAGGLLTVQWLLQPVVLPGASAWLVAPCAMVLAGWVVCLKWQSREQNFQRIAWANFLAAVGAITVQLIGPWWGIASGGCLLTGMLVGRLLGVSVLGGVLVRDWGHLLQRGTLRRASRFLVGYWRFPALSAPSSLIGRASGEAPKLMLALLFTPHVLGLYAFSLRILQVPMSVVGQAVAEVFYPRFAALRGDPDERLRLFARTLLAMAAFVTPIMLALLLVARDAVAFVCGPEWRAAGDVIRVLIPALWVEFMAAPLVSILQATRNQRALLVWQLSLLGLTLAVFPLFAMHGALAALLAYSLMSAFMYGLLVFLCYRVAADYKPGFSLRKERLAPSAVVPRPSSSPANG